MRGILIRWLISAIGLLVVSYLVPGIVVEGFFYALAAAAFLGVLNAVVRPVLIILTLPLTVVTLGVFVLVINGLMLLAVSTVIKGIHVTGFWPAFWGAILLGLINLVSNSFIGSEGKIEYIEMRQGRDGRWR